MMQKEFWGAVLAACTLAACPPLVRAGAEYPELPLKITDETAEQKAARMAWWVHDRFGLFVHFGLYACPARHEWVKSREYIDDRTYDSKYLPRFDPDLFDAREWARMAKAAGMKYAVLTTKHHEGFCMWDTKTTDYKITKTAFGRDLVREFVDAFRAEGIRIGFYFSIKDWHHPDYLIDMCHPLRPRDPKTWSDEKFAELNRGRDWSRYRTYMWDQIRELLTEYGKIDIIWYDYTVKNKEHPNWGKTYKSWDAVNLVKLTRKLQPGIIIDNRLDLMDTDDGWDFVTPEQFKASAWPTIRGKRVPWETCQTFSGSWGYHRDETSWKSVPQLIELLTETVSKGGNLILNVGPTARGEFDERAKERLAGLARWMHWNARAIYGCTVAPDGIVAPKGADVTYNPKTKRAYIMLYDYPTGFLPLDWVERVEYAQFLHDGSEIQIRQPRRTSLQAGDVRLPGGLQLPVLRPNVDVPVVEVWLGGVEAETAKWQSAIDACARSGGGRVTIPVGRHRVGQLDLKSNVELHLDEGAVLEGAAGLENYHVRKLPFSEGTWSAVVMAVGVTNVAITGKGEIFGNGAAWNPPAGARDEIGCTEGLRPRGILFADSSRIRLDDFKLRDAACWGIVFKRCRDVEAHRVRIDSVANINNDGFDVEAANVLIEDCDVNSGDDAYCIKSNDPDFVVENVVVRRCVARSHCNALKLGTASHGTMRNIRFEHCAVEAPTRVYRDLAPMPKDLSCANPVPGAPTYLCGAGIGAICIECVDGGVVEDVTVEHATVSGFQVPIFVRGGRRRSRACGIPPSDKCVLRKILIRDVRGRAEQAIPSSVTGVDGCRPADVRLEDVAIECRGAGGSDAPVVVPGTEYDGRYPEANMFRDLYLPTYGLFVDRAVGVTLKNVVFTLCPGTSDVRPAFDEKEMACEK